MSLAEKKGPEMWTEQILQDFADHGRQFGFNLKGNEKPKEAL